MAVLLASLASLMVATIATPVAVETTLCALVASPKAFDGKVVRFRAGVLTDWHHGMLLVHSGCQRGVKLTSTDAVPSHQSKALDEAVGTPLDGAERTAMATFTGHFSVSTGERQHARNSLLMFNAERIEGVQVYRRKERR